jgi:sulfopyruvate decarboxylase subunit alpha
MPRLAEKTMSDASTVALSPETVLAQMKQNGVTDVVWLPDSETTPLTLLGTPRVG